MTYNYMELRLAVLAQAFPEGIILQWSSYYRAVHFLSNGKEEIKSNLEHYLEAVNL